MAREIALGIVIGGAVSATFGKAISDTQSKIVGLRKTAAEKGMWQRQIGETIKLQDEFRRLHRAGDSAAETIRRKLDSNLRTLRDAGIEVDRLDRAYARLGRTARGLELRAMGHERLSGGREAMRGAVGDSMKLTAAIAVPTMVSAQYQAIIRDIAIKAGIARTGEERAMSDRIRRDALANGMSRNELAEAVNQMVAGGMDLDRALGFAPAVAKFSIGQGATSVETAKMIQALEQNADIKDPAAMLKALEAIAYLGKEGSFESVDMARWFPVLLAEMKKIGITGQDSVTQLGAMLQVQMKTAGNPDEAANNLKNWFSKIGSGETKRNYEKAGVDYEAKMKEAIGKGWSTLEASFVLARAYIERVDPAKAKQLAEAAKSINAELDPEKRQKQIRAFEETMKTGDLFTDMQVKAALTAYLQNADIYQKMKRNGADISGQIQKDLDDRRETSKQIWKEVVDQWDDAMRSIGDALRPMTDLAGEQAKKAGAKVRDVVDASPRAAAAVIGVAGAAIAYRGARAAWSIGRGVLDVARGARMARGGGGKGGKGAKPGRGGQALDALGAASGVQRVFVVNLPSGGIGGGSVGDLIEGAAGAASGKAGRGGRFGRFGRALGGLAGRALPYAGKIALAGTVLKIGLAAKDAYAVAAGDDPRARKAESFAGIGGSLAGGVVGAKLGASIGAFGGPIGAAIGGVAGGAIGTFAGQKLLGALTRWAFQHRGDTPEAARAVANAKALVEPGVAERRAFKVEQQNSFAPVFNIKLEGGSDQAMADRLLARINPQIQRAMTQSMNNNNRSALFDAPHL
ncbi:MULTISPECIES: phage tail tape measure protein [pseudomallei group]|uniref:phage tail tape measure protein n=1 Tax=pseudomallei group TaxID=111527 RepID=UPI0005B72050|nr:MULTISPECIES: phage tail tape measure protein [pseudomallei group]AVR10983.1 phage tail tape measure protein [Burkholderia thailandensis]KIS58688.1 phage tail tape measure protein, TP901 family, core region [Burkholderia thailandensis Phuket 4W-1]MBF4044430.1 phage tail tape measure protein [Burkholderia pseudomallei]ONF01692.1 phage tail protein [Burkholderia pseudomallei]WRS67230.1 phage tail tape measure protein [Burkholderia thailandensis]